MKNLVRVSCWILDFMTITGSFFCYKFFKTLRYSLIYDAVLVSGIQQSDSVIHICIYSLSDSFPL